MLVGRISPNLSFGRALKDNEIGEFKKTLNEGKQLAGQTGNSVFIMPSTSMPQSAGVNTGVSNLVSDESIKYLNDMKTYLGFNVVEDLPVNQFYGVHYRGSALSLGEQNINPELLTTEEYGSILKKEEFDEIVKANSKENKESIANFENVMGKDSAQMKALKQAHERFKALDENSDLKKRYNEFVKNNEERLSIARENELDADFFKFKQFLAEDHLKKGIAKLHEQDIRYCRDVALNFDADEVKAFPNAFKKDHYMGVPGWTIDSLNFDNITDESSDAYKLLKMKVQYAAKDADMLRFDAAWNYVTPIVTPKGESNILDSNRKSLGDNLLKLIEQWVKEVKGDDFDVKKNLMYEFEAGVKEFSPFWEEKLIPGVKDRVNIYQTTYMNDGWGSNEAFKARGWTADELSVGVGNHDSQPLRQVAEGVHDTVNGNAVHKNASINPLAKILKLDAEALQNPVEFAKAKWAETLTGKNNHFFFADVFGWSDRFNDHTGVTNKEAPVNYRRKVSVNYMQNYLDSVKEGFGFNIMDSLAKVFKAKGLDESNPDLYQKIVKFSNIIADKEELNEKAEEVISDTVKSDTVKAAESSAEKPAAAAAAEAAETVVENTGKAASKVKSYKPLWYALGALAVAGGAFAIVKNRHPKPLEKEEPKKIMA